MHDTVTLLNNKTKEKLGYCGETLKEIVEDEAEKEHQEEANQEEDQQDDINLTPKKHKTALKVAYKSFYSPGLPKAYVDTYIEKITPYVRSLIEQQIKEMGSTKVQLCIWVKWKKTWSFNLVRINSKKQRIFLTNFMKYSRYTL